MLFRKETWDGLADGSITVAFRRWRRPTVRPGGTLTTPTGVLHIDSVDMVEPHAITDVDARAAGHPDTASVLADLRPDGTLYRIRFHHVGDDPRIELRTLADLSDDEFDAIRSRLGRLGWSVPTLRSIDERPGTVSTELAAAAGVERQVFKQRVRRLKQLGLTESLEVGYRLSPRGRAVLDHLDT